MTSTSKNFTAEIVLNDPDLPDIMIAIVESLKPELISDDTNISLDVDRDCLKIAIVSSDIVSLRAAVNSYLRLAEAAYQSIFTLRGLS